MSNDRHDGPTEKSVSITSRERSLVFISHDTRDAELAEALSKLLSRVSAGVLKSFRSSDRRGNQGIEYGVEWYPEIMANLDKAFDVVCLLTRRSVDRPWILYEAGVAKGKLGAKVYGLALGIPLDVAITGPFAQFQNSGDDTDSLTKLVIQLLRHIPNAEPDTEAVQMQVEIFKEQVHDILLRLDDNGENNLVKEQEFDGSSVAKLFEEVKVMFQDLPSRIDNVTKITNISSNPSIYKSMEFYRFVLRRFISETRGGSFEYNLWLILISSFQHDIPWLYEAGLEVYKSQVAHRHPARLKLLRDFYQLLTITTEAYFPHSMSSDDFYPLCHELTSYLDYYINHVSKKDSNTASFIRNKNTTP